MSFLGTQHSPVWSYLSSTSVFYQTLCCQPSASLSLGGMQALALHPLPMVFVSPCQVCVRVRSYVKVLIIFCLEFFSSAQIILVSHLHSWESKINREGEMEESWKDLLLHIKKTKNETDWRFKIRMEIWSSKSRFFFSIRPRMTWMTISIFQGCCPILSSQGLPPISQLLSIYYLYS